MFQFIKNRLQSIYRHLTTKLSALFTKTQIDAASLQELEKLLLASDVGVATTRTIIAQLKTDIEKKGSFDGQDLKQHLHKILTGILDQLASIDESHIYLFVGVNGSGKTTSAAKLAYQLQHIQDKKVLLVAADTFRAAATEQLTRWADKYNFGIVVGSQGQDPASVVFTGCQRFQKEDYDILIIDTAGRLQTKINLMNELAKIHRIIQKQLPEKSLHTILTIDSLLGQNSFEQAKLFKESTHVNSIVLTKMDGTAKGGIVFAIASKLAIPISYITFGEQIDQIIPFNSHKYVSDLLGN